MRLSRLLLRVALVCAPVALFGTIWLYLYPIFQGCAFPTPPSTHIQSIAPFRLLALGDPQLEGDSSLPRANAIVFSSLEQLLPDLRNTTTFGERRNIVAKAAKGVVKDAARWLEGKRKAIDLWGNDWYLAHIVRSQRWWTEPTHISVLGDLLGSQWITNGEFEKRAGRYWNIVMRGLEKVPDSVFGVEKDNEQETVSEETIEAQVDGEVIDSNTNGFEQVAQKADNMHVDQEVGNVGSEGDDQKMSEVGGDNGEKETLQSGPNEEENKERLVFDDFIENIGIEDVGREVEHEEEFNEEASKEKELQEGESKEEESKEEEVQDEVSGEQEVKAEEREEDESKEGEHKYEESKGEEGNGEESKEEAKEGAKEEGEEEEDEAVEDTKRERKTMWGGTTEVLGADKSWEKRVINIAGNHDVGYAGDLDQDKVERFEEAFGSVNWDIWFTLPEDFQSTNSSNPLVDDQDPPALRLVILNTMNFDTPAWSGELQTETYSFMNHIITTARDVQDKTHATILLTHIPLEKEAGVCVDSPLFVFWDGGGVKEQNMVSGHGTRIVLEGIFGLSQHKEASGGGFGRHGVIVNGHDHAGCDVLHWIRQPGMDDYCNASTVKKEEAYWPPIAPIDVEPADSPTPTSPNEAIPFVQHTSSPDVGFLPGSEPTEPDKLPKWRARRFPTLLYDINEDDECTTISQSPRIREITLRSMMGEFAGYAGFLSAWFDTSLGERGEWVFEFNSCSVGIQHWWWGVHILDLILVFLLIGACVANIVERKALEREIYDGLGSREKIGEASAQFIKKKTNRSNGTTRTSKFSEPETTKRKL